MGSNYIQNYCKKSCKKFNIIIQYFNNKAIKIVTVNGWLATKIKINTRLHQKNILWLIKNTKKTYIWNGFLFKIQNYYTKFKIIIPNFSKTTERVLKESLKHVIFL